MIGVCPLAIECFADAIHEKSLGDCPCDGASALEASCGADEGGEISFPEMRFDFGGGLEGERLFFGGGVINGHELGGFAPVVHGLLTGDDFDLFAQVGLIGHLPAETIFVEFFDGDLVSVMVGWAENSSCGAAFCDVGEVALWRFDLGLLFAIEAGLHEAERVAFDQRFIEADRAVLDLVKRMLVAFRGDSYLVTFWFIEEEACRAVERVGFATGLDLFCDRFGGSVGGKDFDMHFGWKGPRNFGPRCEGALIPAIGATSVAIVARATIAARAAVVVPWAALSESTAVASTEAGFITARATSVVPIGITLEVGVGIVPWGFFQPVGEELEIEWERGFFAHGAGWKEGDGIGEMMIRGS